MIELLQTALTQYGIKELPGTEQNNPKILKYFKGHAWVKTDETAWCSAFVDWCALYSGFEHTQKLNARSWLDVGWEPEHPESGDIAIFWRESKSSWKGHVGIYINKMDDNINVLGGNQNNSVCIKPYPKSRLLGYRRLKKL